MRTISPRRARLLTNACSAITVIRQFRPGMSGPTACRPTWTRCPKASTANAAMVRAAGTWQRLRHRRRKKRSAWPFSTRRASAGDRQMEVCMQCHLQTTSLRLPATIRRFDRGPFSYRAGQPLSEFLLFFDRAPAAGGEPKFEIVSSVARLREWTCFAASKGALTCLTCHDRHQIPRGEEAARHYNGVCQRCHASALDRLGL
jgi:hypothetical protein